MTHETVLISLRYRVLHNFLNKMIGLRSSTTNDTVIEIIFIERRCPWRNGYRRRKWTSQHEFKSWTRLIAYHKAVMLLGKVWIPLFSLQLWVNSWADLVLQHWFGSQSRRRKTLNPNLLKPALKIDPVPHPTWVEGFVNTYIYWNVKGYHFRFSNYLVSYLSLKSKGGSWYSPFSWKRS